jgi:hypothetical protein
MQGHRLGEEGGRFDKFRQVLKVLRRLRNAFVALRKQLAELPAHLMFGNCAGNWGRGWEKSARRLSLHRIHAKISPDQRVWEA